MAPLFFSEYAEGSSNHKYFEIYNPTSDTVSLDGYAYPNVSNAPTTVGQYEWWNSFDAGAVILPNDVYVVAHPSADPSILAEADETHSYLSNGDDGYALVFGDQTSYIVMDWLGDWNGDPGSGWSVAGVSNATKDHTLVRKCSVTSGDTSWSNAAGTDSLNSQWLVYASNTWTYLGSHVTPCPTVVVLGCTSSDIIISEGATSGEPEDFIEIQNISGNACDMLGWQLDDSDGFSDWTFPSAVIPAGGFWYGDEDASSSAVYDASGNFVDSVSGSFGSGLSSGGDEIWLTDGTDTLNVVLQGSQTDA